MKKFITILSIFVIMILVSGCASPWYRNSVGYRTVLDAKCDVDEDCTTAMVQCSCDCGIPINKIYEQKYLDKQEEKCKFYTGMMCKMDCKSKLKCINNMCTDIDK